MAQLFLPLFLTSLGFKTFPFSPFFLFHFFAQPFRFNLTPDFRTSFRDQNRYGIPFGIAENSSQFPEKISFSLVALAGILDQGRRKCVQVERFMLVPESPMIDKGIEKLRYR